MTEEQKERLRQKWKERIKEIGYDLGECRTSHTIYTELCEIANKNKKVMSPNLLFRWLKENYADSISMGIRRLNDRRKGMWSLKKLIEDIREHREVITRDYFVSQYPQRMQDEGFADRDFDNFANQDVQTVSVKKLNADIGIIDKDTKIIIDYANVRIAHPAKNKSCPMPTIQNVGTALDAIDKIFCDYNMFLTGGGMTTAEPVIAFDWKEPLRHAWIKKPEQEQ